MRLLLLLLLMSGCVTRNDPIQDEIEMMELPHEEIEWMRLRQKKELFPGRVWI